MSIASALSPQASGERIPRSAQRYLCERDLAVLRAIVKDSPRAVGFSSDRWSPARVSSLLATQFSVYYSPRHAVRVLRRHGLDLKFKRAREMRLSYAQTEQLKRLLGDTPSAAGLEGDSWTRQRLAELIWHHFGVKYSAQYIGRFVKALHARVNIVRRERRLTRVQIEALRIALAESPRAIGYAKDHWSRPLVARFIAERFNVRYHPHSILHMLQRWQLMLPKSSRVTTSSKLDAKQVAELSVALAHTPQENGLQGNFWTQRRVATLVAQRFGVELRPHAVNRLLVRLQIEPQYRAPRGGAIALNTAQIAELAKILSTTPTIASGGRGRWTRRSIARAIQERFDTSYSPASIPRLLRRCHLQA